MSHGMKLLHHSHSTNGDRLKFADTYYGEMTHYGLYRLAWADVRRAR